MLGASGAGLQAAHYVLKYILPDLKAKNDGRYHVYLISPISYWYFRNASPRVAASTDRMALDKVQLDIRQGFKQYSPEDFTFIEASATGLNQSAREVLYRKKQDAEDEVLTYHALVIATGSSTHYPAFSMSMDAQETLDSITFTNEKVATAKSIVIAGGGPTAVEFAGEVAEHRNGKPGWFSKVEPKAEITLIAADEKLLPGLRPAIRDTAAQKLEALGVKVVLNSRVTGAEPAQDGRTVLTLKNGDKLDADLYVPAYGVRPNSSWIPKELLDENGYVATNNSTLRVDSAGPRVYALGDVGSYSRNNFFDILDGLPVLGVNLKRDLVSYNSMLPDEKPKGKDREFKPNMKESMAVPVGSGGGVGALFGWRLPSFFVRLIKGRDYMIGMSGLSTVNGSRVSEAKWTKEEAPM